MLGITQFQDSERFTDCGRYSVLSSEAKLPHLLAAGLVGDAEWFMHAAAVFMALAVALLSVSLSGPAPMALAAPPATPIAHITPPPEERVDINHAPLAELLEVHGLTQSWAARIVRFRPYRTKQDLLDRGVLNGQVYDRIKDYVIAHREKKQPLKPVRKYEGDGPKPVPFMQFHNTE
jgi:hypothetical protein